MRDRSGEKTQHAGKWASTNVISMKLKFMQSRINYQRRTPGKFASDADVNDDIIL